MFVLMGGSFPRSQFHLHPFRALTPSPTFYFLPFMPFTVCSFDSSGYLVVLISFYFFSFSPTFCRLVAFARVPVYPRPLLPPASPRSYPLQAQHWYTNTRSKYLLFTSFTLKRSGFPMHLLLRNSLTRSLHRMPNSHDPLPISSSPTPPHPPIFTYNRHSTGI